MGKPISLEPAWLVGLLNKWAHRDARSMSGGLGFPSKSAFTIERTDGGQISDPTGYSIEDLDAIESALHQLALEHPEMFVAVSMYYRPWTVIGFMQQGYPFGAGNATYYRRLHEAHRLLAIMMPTKEHAEA